MTRDEVVRLAREIWGQTAVLPFADLERFAALVADAARGDYYEGFEEGYKAGAERERESALAEPDEPLTEEAVMRLYREAWAPESEANEVLAFARAVERAHGVGGKS